MSADVRSVTSAGNGSRAQSSIAECCEPALCAQAVCGGSIILGSAKQRQFANTSRRVQREQSDTYAQSQTASCATSPTSRTSFESRVVPARRYRAVIAIAASYGAALTLAIAMAWLYRGCNGCSQSRSLILYLNFAHALKITSLRDRSALEPLLVILAAGAVARYLAGRRARSDISGLKQVA